MKAEAYTRSVVIRCSRDEVGRLLNCMNEAREAIDGWEIQTRLGIGRDEVLRMIGILDGALGTDG